MASFGNWFDDNEQEGEVDAPKTGISGNWFDSPATDSEKIRQAIRQTESGGDYTVKGASGEKGAYQFMPSTWNQFSNEYNQGKGALEQTPENEEAVVEHKINQWIDEGLSPQEIAAKWNSGSHKNWENKRGTNRHGVKYDVPEYVNKVMSVYEPTESIVEEDLTQTDKMVEELQPQDDVSFAKKVGNIAHRFATTALKSFPTALEGVGVISKHTAGATVGDIQMMGGEASFPSEDPADPTEQARKVTAETKSAVIEAAKGIKEWLPRTPERVRMGGVMKIIDEAAVGQAHYADVMVAGGFNKFLAMPVAYLTILPDKYNQYVDDESVDPEHAYKVASAAAAPLALVESISEVKQVGRWKGAFKKVVDKTAKGPAKKILGAIFQGAKTEATEEWVQGSIELAFDIWAKNPDKDAAWIADEYWRIFKTPEFQAGNAYGAIVGAVGGGGMGGGMSAAGVTYNGLRKKLQGNQDIDTGEDTEVSHTKDGNTVITPVAEENETSHDLRDVEEPGDRPAIDQLLGNVSGEDRVEVSNQTVDGKTVGTDLVTTPEQAARQKGANESVKSILAKVETDEGLKKANASIKANEEKLEGLENFYQLDMEKGDHEGALRTAEMMQQTAQEITAGYQSFQQNYLKKLEQKKLLADPNEFVDMDLHVQKINQRAKQAVAAQKSALNNIRIEEQQTYIETLGTTQGLESDLMTESVKASRQGKSEASKVYGNVLQEMKLLKHQGDFEYLRSTPVNKLMKLKLQIDTLAINEMEDSTGSVEEDRAMIRTDAMRNWINDTLTKRSEFDQVGLAEDRMLHEAKKADQAAKAARDAKVAKDQAAKGAVDARTVRRAEKNKQTRQRKLEERRVAEKSKKVEKGKRTVSDLRTALRKPVPGETRTEELKEVKTAKAERVASIERQRQQVEGTPAKGQTKVADLKKETNEFVILTSDNPNSTTVSDEQNKINRSKLIKQLDRLGVSYTIGKSKFEGMDEVPFVIHGMTRSQGKKLSDQLGQSSFIHVKGKNTALIEGNKVAPGDRGSIRMSPTATDFYTEINGEKFTMDFDFDNQNTLDVEQMQIDDEAQVALAQRLYRAAGIQYKGKVYEGTSHLNAMMQNSELVKIIQSLTVDEIEAQIKDGYVTHDGQFDSRDMAASRIGVDELMSEDFMNHVADQKLAGHKNIEVADFSKMTLQGKMGTLEVIDAIQEDMKNGKYSEIFKKTDATGIKTIFISAPGQYGKLDVVKRSYPDIKNREGAIKRFEGDMGVDPKTGKMVHRGGVKGSYMSGHHTAIINIPNISKTASNIGQAVETVVHEHTHGLVKVAFDGMNTTQKLEVERELKTLWESLGENFKRQQRDDPATHPRIRVGIRQIDDSIGELITYSMAHPEFAAWLDAIPASPRFRAKTSKIKSIWDALVDLIRNKVVKSKYPTTLDEVTDILNRHMKLGDGTVKTDTKSKEQFQEATASTHSEYAKKKTDTSWDQWDVYRRDFGLAAQAKGISLELIEYDDELFINHLNIPDGKRQQAVGLLRKIAQESKRLNKPVVAQIVNKDLAKSLTKRGLELEYVEEVGGTRIRFSLEEDLLSFDFGANVSPEFVKDWAAELDGQAANALPTIVVDGKSEMETALGFKVEDNVKAVWSSDGKLIVRSDMIQSQDEFVSTWMHEQVAHQGLRNVFGQNKALFNRFLDQAYTLFTVKEPQALFEMASLYNIGKVKQGKAQYTKVEKRLLAEEMIARRAESMKPVTKKGLITRFREFLKRWLPKKFVNVQSDFKLTDSDIMNMLSMARENVLTGSTQFTDMLTKAIEQRRPQHIFQGQEKLPAFIESDETYLEWAEEVLKKAPELKKWYSQHVETIAENFGPDVDLFNVLLAVTSPQADVETNVQFAVDTYAYMMGLRSKPGALFPNVLKARIDNNWTSPENMLADLESKNFKVTEFTRALLGDPDATVGDLWMFRLFYGDQAVFNKDAETYSVGQITGLRQKLHELAAKMTEKSGETWTPREMQAALWTYINAKQTGKEIKQVASYQSGLHRKSEKYGGMSPLEWLNKKVPNLKDGPLSSQIGIAEMPLAPISPLQKKLIGMHMKEKTKPLQVSEDGDISVTTPDMDNRAVAKMVQAIADGGQTITAINQEHAVWLKKIFGFESIDGLEMKLTPTAVNLYSDAKGKVKVNLIRDNLGGFSGNYSRVVRFQKAARENLDQIANMSQDNINIRDAQFIKTGNDGDSVLGKVYEWRDQAALNIDRFTSQLEQEFLEKFGGRKSRVIALGSGRKLNTNDTELLQKAMNLYIDSGTGSNLARVEAYLKKLAARGMKNLTGREKQQVEIMDRMLNMSQEERAWADSTIRPYYEDFFSFAQEHGILDSHVDNYVKRTWKMPKALQDSTVVWSGSGNTGFKLIPSSGKARSLDSIVDGWDMGLDMQTEGVLNNLNTYGNEIGYTFSNRRFVDYMRSMIDFKTDGLMFEVDTKKNPDFQPGHNYVQVTAHGFAKPFHKLYAEKGLANEINRLGATASHSLWNVPIVKFITRINSGIKSTILSVSLFHHLAGMRSYVFGVSGKGWKINPISAYKRGLDKIAKQTTLEGNLKSIGPVVDYLVKEGLTLGRTQDWDESSQQSYIEDALLGMTGKGTFRLLNAWQGLRRFKRGMTTGLFNRLFAGLKAESATYEFVHRIKKDEKKLGRHLNDAELKLAAKQTATLINADFGGLHIERMGRNKDLQKLAQTLLLAPDWTESNWRTVSGMIPGMNKLVNKAIGDRAEVPGMGKVYRKFWGGIIVRGAMSVIMAQAAILGLFATDDERDAYIDNLVSNLTWEKFHKGQWAKLDITPITRKLGIGKADKRQTFSIMGHFLDILKVGDLRTLVKHKVSPFARIFETWWSGSDWKGTRFNTIGEMLESGQLTADNPFADDVRGIGTWSQLLPIALYNVRQSIPIFGSEFLQALQGESSWLSSAMRAGGMDVRDVSETSIGQQKYEEVNSEINELERNLKDAQTIGDRRMIVEARKDIRRYDGFNKKKSRIGFTRAQLRPINRELKKLKLKEESDKGLTNSEQRKMDRLIKRRLKVFEKFRKVIER